MPFPDEAVTVTGGCSCGAVRYRIAIPKLEDRPLHPMTPPSLGFRLPSAITCHCNDCRRATGSFLATGVLDIPSPMLTVSAISPSSESTIVSGRILDVLADDYDAQKADEDRPPYVPAMDILRADKESKTWLRFFHSTKCGPDLSRSFCARCGTQLCFHFKLAAEYCFEAKLPDDWQDFFHLYHGSLDREFLEKDWFAPHSEVNFKYGTPFTKSASATAKGLKCLHKLQGFDEDVAEEELAKLSS
ncbi:hypothetical protein FALBO_4528 [Fusarium albosuccineum]|uniref:CENP-V/GFA domain-containing protein n=1 Tax=Fusarium albosuccineum TaxID=1237068 RepID=A0A8H4LJF6_9HYPO|nr:hypothetical protein FALBO_4528 [Fusarium albosuccineum]